MWASNLQFQQWPMTEISPPFCKGKMREQKNQDKLEEMEIAVSQNSDSEIVSDCNKLPQSSFLQSTCTLMFLGSLFFSNMGSLSRELQTKRLHLIVSHLLWTVTGSEYRLLLGS